MRLRLFFSFFLIVLITVTAVVLLTRRSAENEVRTFMLRGGMAGLEDLKTALEDYYQTNGGWLGVESVLAVPGRGQGMGPGGMMGQGNRPGGIAGMLDQRLRLVDDQGQVIVDTAGEEIGVVLSREELKEAVRLQNGRNTVGYLLAEGGLSYSSQDVQDLVSRFTNAALTAGLVAGGLALVLALLLSYRLLKPIQELTHAAERLGNGDLSQRVPVRGDDEMAVLGHSFNQMADSLERANESRRASTADIAHELRNPLAVQRASLEALLDGIYPLTPENLAPILDQNVLLSRLVDDLRTVALADAGQLTLERRPTDLLSLTNRVVERFLPQASTRQIEIRVDPLPTASKSLPYPNIDPQRVEQILNNLLSNALRLSPDGERIDVSLSAIPGAVELAVQDRGPGIPEESLPYIFERFYRADRSRSRLEGGTGLGLTIARQLAQAHGGSLEARNRPGGGAMFTLRLPI